MEIGRRQAPQSVALPRDRRAGKVVGRDSVEPISSKSRGGENGRTAFGVRQPAAALLATARMGCSLGVIEGRPPISLLHYSITAFTPPLHCVEDNEPLEHRHACLCGQRAFSLLKGNRLQACLAHRLGSLCSSAPCPDNEPLKNGNQATAYRSSMC